MTFLLEMLWKSAAIAGAVLLLLRLLRGQHPADRAAVLRISGLVLLALPVVALTAPALTLAVLEPEAISVAVVEADGPSLPRASTSSAQTDVGSVVSVTTPWDDPAPLVMILYLGGVAFVGLRLAVGIWTLKRWTDTALPVADPAWLRAFDRVAASAGAPAGVRLLETVECGSPLSWGWRAPVILVDRDRLSHPEDAEAILAHEIAHIVRRDWPALMAMHVATAIFWFNPLVWLLEREAVQQAEEAADAQALARTEPTHYAQMLLSYADYACSGVPANCMAPPKGLARRVKAILAHGLREGGPRRTWARAAILGCLAVAAPISAAKFVAAQAPADKKEAKASIASQEWAEAAGIPVAAVTPVTPVTPTTPVTPKTPVRPLTPKTPATPSSLPPVAPVAPVARVEPSVRVVVTTATNGVPMARAVADANGVAVVRLAANDDRDSRRAIEKARRQAARDRAEALRESAETRREAEREAAQDRREAEQDRREAERDAAQAARDAAEAARDAAEDGAGAMIDSRALRIEIAHSVDEGMRSGADGMDRGAAEMRAEARRLRDPAYRKQVISEQSRWDHKVTDQELVNSIPRLEAGADRMVAGAQRMREGAVRAADGQRRALEGQRRTAVAMRQSAQRMREGADRMDAGARRMLEAAANLRRSDYRRQKIAEAAARGDTQTDEELLRAIPGLEEGARNMTRSAAQMRKQASAMART